MKHIAVSLFLLSTASAQALAPATPVMDALGAPGIGTGLWGPILPVRVSNFGMTDIAYIRGGQPFVTMAPGMFVNTHPLPGLPQPSVTTEIAVSKGSASNNTDTIVLVGDYGLAVWSTQAGGTTAAQILNSAWAGATDLHVGDMDGDGTHEAVALAPNGRSVLIHPLPGSTFPTTTRAYSSTILTVAPVDYTPAVVGDELCLVYSNSIEIEGGDNAGAFSFSQAIQVNDAMATRVVTPYRELLAVWASASSSALPDSSILALSSDIPMEICDLYGQDPLGLGVGDSTGTGFDDIHMVYANSSGIDSLLSRGSLLYPHLPAPQPIPHFEYSYMGGLTGTLPTEAIPISGETVRPAFLDLDSDGDIDFVTSRAGEKFTIGFSGLVDPSPMAPFFTETEAEFPPNNYALLQLEFDVTAAAVPGATHMQVLAWEVREEPNGLVTLPTPTHRFEVPWTSGTPTPVEFDITNRARPHPSANSIHSGFYVFVRMVTKSAGEVVKTFPSLRFARVPTARNWIYIAYTPEGGENPNVVTPPPDFPPPPPPGDPVGG